MGRSLFCHGSRRRKKIEKSTNPKKSGSSAPVNKRVTQNVEADANTFVDQSICIEDRCQDAMQVERVTTHEEPAIYGKILASTFVSFLLPRHWNYLTIHVKY